MSLHEDVLATDELTITLMRSPLHVGRVAPGALQSCAWPLLKAMFGSAGAEVVDEDFVPRGFFSFTQEEAELTIVMDDRCRGAFDEAVAVASVEYAPHRWCAFELHLGSLAWEVPGLVCHLATLMAESDISILNLSSHDRDFLLVRESDGASAEAEAEPFSCGRATVRPPNPTPKPNLHPVPRSRRREAGHPAEVAA